VQTTSFFGVQGFASLSRGSRIEQLCSYSSWRVIALAFKIPPKFWWAQDSKGWRMQHF